MKLIKSSYGTSYGGKDTVDVAKGIYNTIINNTTRT